MEKPEILLLDGGMGTMLQAAGLPLGCPPELWNVTEPEKVAAVQRRYAAAGSRVLYTNTFGANRCKLAGCGHSPAELIAGGVRCARAAAEGYDVRVALDIGPLGQLLEPLGTLRFEEAYDILLKHGFKNRLGENETIDSKRSKAATMISPSGFIIALVQHIK